MVVILQVAYIKVCSHVSAWRAVVHLGWVLWYVVVQYGRLLRGYFQCST